MRLSVIDWRITSKCNNECYHCYGSKALDTVKDLDRIIEFIKYSRCQAVCITGGEPLLENRSFDAIKKLYSANISIFLSTNGTNYMANRERIEPYIKKLSLPLDGFDKQSNTVNGRIPKSFNRVTEILNFYQKNPPKFKIKIGTVLTKRNMYQEHFEKMYKFLCHYNIISKWKIFELLPEGQGYTSFSEFGYTSEEYNEMASRIDKYVTENSLNNNFIIDYSRRKPRNGAYFIILPNADVIIPIDNGAFVEERLVGNIITDSFDKIITSWENQCNVENCFENFEKRLSVESDQSLIAKLEQYDRKLLYYLDKDPLELDSSIEEKLGRFEKIDISREKVQERLEYLYNVNAIDHIMPLINISKFGFNVYLCNLYFNIAMKNSVPEIAEILKKNDNIAWIAECYDWENEDKFIIFRIAIFAENNTKMQETLNHLERIFGNSLNWETDNVPDKNVLGQRYILGDNGKTETAYNDSHLILDSIKKYKLTKKQYRFFTYPKNKRYNLKNISNYTGIKEKKLQSIIRKLMEDNIIQKFQAVYNPKILGYYWYKFFIKFADKHIKLQFEEEIKKYVCVMHTNTLTQGRWDMDFEIHISDPNEAFKLWSKLKNQFGQEISDEKIIRINKEYKFDFLPEIVLRSMLNK